MLRSMFIVALAAAALELGAQRPAGLEGGRASLRSEWAPASTIPRARYSLATGARVPQAWLPQDPADSIYRVGRQLFNRGQYRNAAESFRRISQRYPTSGYAPTALFWEAQSLSRIGGVNELRAALGLLEQMKQRYPNAANPDPALVTKIQGELARRGDPQYQRLLANAANNRGQACNRDDQAVRLEALNALSRMNIDSTTPILRDVLARRDACSVSLRRQAITLLAKKSDAATTDVLIDVVKNDPSLDVRRAAISWLGDVPSDRGIAALEEILRSPTDAALHSAALRAITSARNPRGGRALQSVIERSDAPEQLRAEAMSALPRVDSAGAGAYLRSLYPRLTTTRLKEQALNAIARTKDAESERWMLAFIRNSVEPLGLRRSALSALSRASTTSAADIGALFQAVPELELKHQVISSLSSRREAAAVDQLIGIYRSTTDPKLHLQIVNALSRRNDARTKQLLLEIIKK